MKRTSLLKRPQTWLLVLAFTIICAIVFSALRNNIRVVIKDQVYRSAQLSPATLKLLTKFKQIRSVINLRGQNPQHHWYQHEIETSHSLGVQHYDIALSSKRFPRTEQLKRLASLLQHAPKPLLLHCESGSDRSGLGSAMALSLLTETPLKTVKQQFSWRYFVTSSHSVGKQVYTAYERWLKKQHKSNSRDHFAQWISHAQAT